VSNRESSTGRIKQENTPKKSFWYCNESLNRRCQLCSCAYERCLDQKRNAYIPAACAEVLLRHDRHASVIVLVCVAVIMTDTPPSLCRCLETFRVSVCRLRRAAHDLKVSVQEKRVDEV